MLRGCRGSAPSQLSGRSVRPKAGRSKAITVPCWLNGSITGCHEYRLAPKPCSSTKTGSPCPMVLTCTSSPLISMNWLSASASACGGSVPSQRRDRHQEGANQQRKQQEGDHCQERCARCATSCCRTPVLFGAADDKCCWQGQRHHPEGEPGGDDHRGYRGVLDGNACQCP